MESKEKTFRDLDLFFKLAKEKSTTSKVSEPHWVCDCPELFIYSYSKDWCEKCGMGRPQKDNRFKRNSPRHLTG